MHTFIRVLWAFACVQLLHAQTQYTQFVNPFIGTGGHGHTFPGAVVPFGMVQLSPDTRIDGSWDGCSGYHYSDSVIYGFTHTHLSGTGVSDWGDVLLMPMMKKPSFKASEYSSRFHHSSEHASPGYYSVVLKDDSIVAELSTTNRVGMHQYTFTKEGSAFIILDLLHRDPLTASAIEVAPNGNTRITGYRRSKGWAQDQLLYYCIEFSKPFTKHKLNSSQKQPTQAWFKFDVKKGERLLVKVAISNVDNQGAAKNMNAELPNWDFVSTKLNAELLWNTELKKIETKGGTVSEQTIFYTSLYHCFIHPSTASDVDGRYRGRDFKVYTAQDFTYYSVFSLWDTFRALHPLFNLIQRQRNLDFIKTMLAQYEQSGRLPMWELSSNETNCMIGYHSVSVITDAYVKGIRGFDEQLAAKACIDAAKYTEWSIPTFLSKGYLEIEDEHESVSKTLEYAYDNWCVATFLKHSNQFPDFEKSATRSASNWAHLYDNGTGFFRPRSNGGWLNPFNPYEVNNHYTEANAWQYAFFIPHQTNEYANHIYPRKLEYQLDSLFNASTQINGRQQADITGLVGQYAHGNEPSHHFIYLYGLVGQQQKMAYYVSKVMKDLYSTNPDGLPGNEDCGQISAWYVFSAIGFYPICPGKNEYVVNTSIFDEVLLEQSPLKLQEIPQVPIINRRASNIISAPIIQSQSAVFTSSQLITAYNQNAGTLLSVKVINANNITIKDTTSLADSISISINESCTVVAMTHTSADTAFAKAVYKLKPNDYEVQLISKPNKQYTAGGANGLLDGVNGNLNWRLGNWMGFQYADVEVIIDLKTEQQIQGITSSYLQDSRSWILLPTAVNVSYSLDGIHYSKPISTKMPLTPREENVFIHYATSNFNKPVHARYLKVKAVNFGKLPKWHQGNGDGAFIFIDEIKIEATK